MGAGSAPDKFGIRALTPAVLDSEVSRATKLRHATWMKILTLGEDCAGIQELTLRLLSSAR